MHFNQEDSGIALIIHLAVVQLFGELNNAETHRLLLHSAHS